MKFLVLVMSTVGSAAGWWLGERIGLMTAFVVSGIGMAAGVWAGRRLAAHWSLD